MSFSLKSNYDKQSYNEYIEGKRKYFTINGMELDTFSMPLNPDEPIELLRRKHMNHKDHQFSHALVKEYMESYNMESGIIFNPDNTDPNYMGCIAYIKDNFLFTAYIVYLFNYEQMDDPKKYIEESFKPQGAWNYQDCCIELLGTTCYENAIAIKKLQIENDILNNTIKNYEAMTSKICFNLVENSEKQSEKIEKCILNIENSFSEKTIRKSISKCFRKLYVLTDKLNSHIQLYHEKEDENKRVYIARNISLITCAMYAFILYVA